MSTDARTCLTAITESPNAIPEQRIALALTGILAAIVEMTDRDARENTLARLHDEADAALGRVLALADSLDAHPGAALKPTAFGDLAASIRTAVDGATA